VHADLFTSLGHTPNLTDLAALGPGECTLIAEYLVLHRPPGTQETGQARAPRGRTPVH